MGWVGGGSGWGVGDAGFVFILSHFNPQCLLFSNSYFSALCAAQNVPFFLLT